MRAEPLQPAGRPDAWRTHLLDVFDSLGIPPGTVADNVAASVAVYCRQFHPRGVQRTELTLLVARPFCAVGNQAAARSLSTPANDPIGVPRTYSNAPCSECTTA